MKSAPFTISWRKHVLKLLFPAKTSYTTFLERPVWYVFLESQESGLRGIGECAPLNGLSLEKSDDIESKLHEIALSPESYLRTPGSTLRALPSLYFALEAAHLDLKNGGKGCLFPSAFTDGNASLRINGLIWMNDFDIMLEELHRKMAEGWRCIKFKIGGIEFEKELDLLKIIRQDYPSSQLEIRVDANGAFSPEEARSRLERLAVFDLHSIEQPIKPGQTEAMKALCGASPVPIALDEELLPKNCVEKCEEVFLRIMPQYLVLKPSLLGGFQVCDHLASVAQKNGIGFWATSALESNVGLNALAQWVYASGHPEHYHGLGTGQIYENNIPSPLVLTKGELRIDPAKSLDFSILQS